MFEIRKEIPKTTKLVLASTGIVAIFLAWVILTSWNLVPPFTLPHPLGVLKALVGLFFESNLVENVWASWWRIFQAFTISVMIALPLGLLMGAFNSVRAIITPITAPIRSMPITAFFPVFLAVFGMDEIMKVSFLFFGIFFSLLAIVVDEVDKVEHVLLETAYTLGAKRRHLLYILFRASLPSVFSTFKVLYDLGWTYVIIAEVINARKGAGYMVEAARKVLDFDRVYASIVAIGIAALIFRIILGLIETKFFDKSKGGKK